MNTCTLGLDIGSTWVKVVAVAADGRRLGEARRATPWVMLGEGRAEMTARALEEAVRAMLAEVCCGLVRSAPDVVVGAVGVAGMAESGVLLDDNDNVVTPIVAWFDPRGIDELDALPATLAASFPRSTGLPIGPIVTFGKLLHLRATGTDLTRGQWLNVPEYVAWLLGGERLSEVSLLARTGLLDQDTAAPWPPAMEHLGVNSSFLPRLATAGSLWGKVSGAFPDALIGSVITVAGHDHLVAAVGAGATGVDQLYDSMGTAEALVRTLPATLDPEARGRLAARGINVVRHLLPGRAAMLAGTKSGLLLRRTLQLIGVSGPEQRQALDAAVLELGGNQAAGTVTVGGADNRDGVLRLAIDGDGLTPPALFAAVLEHGTGVLRDLVDVMDREVGPARTTIVSGGWAGMASVRRARRAALPGVSFSTRTEETAFGAALVAAFAADPSTTDLAAFAADRPHPRQPTPTGGCR